MLNLMLLDADLYGHDYSVFSGTIVDWGDDWGRLITDSGLDVTFTTHDQEAFSPGTRVDMMARKLHRRFYLTRFEVLT